MIEIKVRPTSITVTGHARAAPEGHDVVCAAVSALFFTLVKSIIDLTDDKDKIEYSFNSGDARLTYKDLSEKSRTLIDSFFIGCCGIMGIHPEHVTIK